MKLRFLRVPAGVSLQDAGRTGYLRYGVAEGGPMDWVRHRMVNHMLGKAPGTTVLECGPAGVDLQLEQGILQLAFAGPGFALQLDQRQLSGPLCFTLRAGQRLRIVPRRAAMWGYLGFQAELALPDVLGSHADHSASGLRAMPVQAQETLTLRPGEPHESAEQYFIDPCLGRSSAAIGILPAAQYDHFSEQQKRQLVDEQWSIARRFDRMAYRLEGRQLKCERGHDILSDGVTMGSIQVPADGRPFVLMADHQPTGGYPKIATVCMADLPRLAQTLPGSPIRFRWIDLDQALAAWEEMRARIDSMTALRGYSASK